MCGCDWNYVCSQHRGTSKDWRLEPLPDHREDENRAKYEAEREPADRPSLNPES